MKIHNTSTTRSSSTRVLAGTVATVVVAAGLSFVAAPAFGAEAPEGITVDTTAKTWTFTKDVATTTPLLVPDGYTVDGDDFTLFVGDPSTTTAFLGAALQNDVDADEFHVHDLTVDGTGTLIRNHPGGSNNRNLFGIRFLKASGTVEDVTVKGILRTQGGDNDGVGIRADNTGGTAAQSVTIDDSTVTGFQKGGIAATGNVTLTVTDSTIGSGLSSTPPNSISVQSGASATITGNTIGGVQSTQNGVYRQSTSVLAYQAADITVSNNTVTGSDSALYFYDSTSAVATGNTIVAPKDGLIDPTTGELQATTGVVASSMDVTVSGNSITDAIDPYFSEDGGEFIVGLEAAAKTTKVQLDEIGEEEASYPSNEWFTGASSYEGTGVSLATDKSLVLELNTQLLKAYPADARPTSLENLVYKGLALKVAEGSEGNAALQIAVKFGENGWTTMYPKAVNTASAQFGDVWVHSGNIAGIEKEATLRATIDAITEASGDTGYEVYAVGVFADGGPQTKLTSLQLGTTEFVFADEVKLVFQSLTIDGVLKVGETLSANVDLNYPGATYKYQWYRSGDAITGATKSTFTLSSKDRAKTITVKVTASKTGFKAVAKTTEKTAKIAYGELAFTEEPTITGDTAVGAKLTVSAAAQSVAAGKAATSYTYQWLRDGAVIKSATNAAYRLTATDVDSTISVRVTAALTGYTSEVATSAATDVVDLGELVAGVPTISGTAAEGKTLTAKPGTWNAAPTFKYSFYADDVLIQRSTSTKLILTWEEVGTVITVKVTGSQKGFTKVESVSSDATTVVK